MLQRKCPKCEHGIMSEVDKFFGWGVERTYVCDKCSHYVSIYENNSYWPYFVFILIELVVFTSDTYIDTFGYIIYTAIFIFLSYFAYTSYKQSKQIEIDYPILGEIDELDLTKTQKEKVKKLQNSNKAITKKVYITIATFLILSYSVIFSTSISEELKGYLFMGIFSIMLIMFLWIKKR